MSTITNNASNPELARRAMKKGSKLSVGGAAFNIGMNIMIPVGTFMDAKDKGDNNLVAGAKAATDFALWQVAMPVMLGKEIAGGLSSLAEAGIIAGRQNRAYVSRGYKANFGGYYVDSEGASNMRQAGITNIQQSKQNVQSGLGGEAKSYYRGSTT